MRHLHDSPDRPVMTHGPFVRSMWRFKVFMVAAILVLGGANTLGWWLYKEQRSAVCEIRNAQIIAANQAAERGRQFLADVAEAMRADGDTNQAAALDRYIKQAEDAERLQPIKC